MHEQSENVGATQKLAASQTINSSVLDINGAATEKNIDKSVDENIDSNAKRNPNSVVTEEPVQAFVKKTDQDSESATTDTPLPTDYSSTKTEQVDKPKSTTVAANYSRNGGLPVSPARLTGQVVTALLFVTVLILVLAWLAKRFGYQQYWGNRTIKLIGQMPLGSRERVVLIEVNGEQMLLGVAPGRVNYLRDIHGMKTCSEEGNETGVPIRKGQEFARYLKSILAQGKPL